MNSRVIKVPIATHGFTKCDVSQPKFDALSNGAQRILKILQEMYYFQL
jgi:hypothetical protein